MAKNLLVFLADRLEFSEKIGQEFVSILGRWSRFCQRTAKDFLPFWADYLAGLFGKAEDFLKLLGDDDRDLVACLRKLSIICH